MSRFNQDFDPGNDTAFRDAIFSTLVVILTMLLILLIQPKKPEESTNEAQRARGNLRVEIFWPNEMDVDIDLWCQSPGLPAVGYSNMQSPVLNLVRDDLGNYADLTGINYEVIFSRGLPAGEWACNIHWFGNNSGEKQVPVNALVTYRKNDDAGSKETPTQITVQNLTMTNIGQESTIIRFKLDENGDIIWDSLNSIFKSIRSHDEEGL